MDRTIENHQFVRWGLPAILGISVLAGLYASSLYSYLLFHSLVELFSIVTAFVIFVIAWHTAASRTMRFSAYRIRHHARERKQHIFCQGQRRRI